MGTTSLLRSCRQTCPFAGPPQCPLLTEETVSRTFTALRRAKVVQYDNKRRLIAISDKQRLKQLATDASDFDIWSTRKRPKPKATLPAAPILQ
jgi:hypothetical protein